MVDLDLYLDALLVFWDSFIVIFIHLIIIFYFF